MNSFNFNGKTSKDFKSLIVNELPSIIRPAEKIERYDNNSRHGSIITRTGKYSNVVKSVECTIRDLSEIDEIILWLNGSGKVTFSNQPDRYFNSVIINQIPFERVIKQYRKFIVEFECEPFGYLLEGSKPILMDAIGQLSNPGNIESSPVITITGTGEIEIIIGQTSFKVVNVESSITVDSVLMEVYKGNEVQNRKLKGKFPTLPTSKFTVSWRGTVTSVEIKPNWRYL